MLGPLLIRLAIVVVALTWALNSSAARNDPSQPAGSAASTGPLADYALDVVLQPAQQTLQGEAQFTLTDAASVDLLLGPRFSLNTLTIDGREQRLRAVREGPLTRWRLPAGAPNRAVIVRWHGTLAPLRRDMRHQDTLGRQEASADERGSYLPASSFWYPVPVRERARLAHAYRVRIDLPEGQRGLVAGTLTSEQTGKARTVSEYLFAMPANGIDLIAGPYVAAEQTSTSIDGRAIMLRTLFHADIAHLAPDYLASVAGYLALYEQWIGPYPYGSFSVVSSPTPTGLGLPTMTYLGQQVLALPFIRDTSLGHEVLHNWWGNGVYADYERGNWSEGLTTFMADYHYAKRNSDDKAREMRLGWLRELSAINPGDDQPLQAFTSRHHGVSQAVGYSKAAMLFVMLRDRIGDHAFDRGIQAFWQQHRFEVADWRALQDAFETASGDDLDVFFGQWLTRRGLPEVTLAAANPTPDALIVELQQTEPPYVLDVPVRIDTAQGNHTEVLRLDQRSQRFEIPLAATAQRVSLDPDSRMLRRLGAFEAPPILRELQFAANPALLLLGDDDVQAAATTLAARLLERSPTAHRAALAADAQPLLVIGEHRAIADWLSRHRLPPAPPQVAAHGDVRMWTLRLASGVPLALISSENASALQQATRPLPHYRQQSWLVLEQGRALARGVWPADVPSIDVSSR